MELKLMNELLKRFPDWHIEALKELSSDIFEYWTESCLDDVLETLEGEVMQTKPIFVTYIEQCNELHTQNGIDYRVYPSETN